MMIAQLVHGNSIPQLQSAHVQLKLNRPEFLNILEHLQARVVLDQHCLRQSLFVFTEDIQVSLASIIRIMLFFSGCIGSCLVA
jgi:hypothetical protein